MVGFRRVFLFIAVTMIFGMFGLVHGMTIVGIRKAQAKKEAVAKGPQSTEEVELKLAVLRDRFVAALEAKGIMSTDDMEGLRQIDDEYEEELKSLKQRKDDGEINILSYWLKKKKLKKNYNEARAEFHFEEEKYISLSQQWNDFVVQVWITWESEAEDKAPYEESLEKIEHFVEELGPKEEMV